MNTIYNIIRSIGKTSSLLGMAGVGLCLLLFAACDTDYVTYDDKSHIMFSDTLTVCAVVDDTEEFDIAIGATNAVGHDRRVAVEVVDSLSNAIEGKHYVIKDYSVVIPAGSRVGHLKLRGVSSSISVYDSLCVTLRLLCDEGEKWSLYGDRTRVMLQKACLLDMEQFTGYALVTSTFLYQYNTSMTRVIRVERDEKDTLGLVLRNFLYDDFDVRVHFTDNDIFNPILHYDDQRMALTSTAFGTKYGDGWLNVTEPYGYTSYYSSCERFMMIYSTVWVPGMAAGTNVVGNFVHSVEMISDERAQDLISQGTPH